MALPAASAVYLRQQRSRTRTASWIRAYWVANTLVVTDAPIGELETFATELPLLEHDMPALPKAREHDGTVVFRDRGWIAGKWRRIRCASGEAGYRLAVAGVGAYRVTRDGRNVDLLAVHPHAGRDVLVQTFLGPVLVLALALRGAWCLHASAVLWQGQAIAVLGESGSGKSTLAAYLGLQNGARGQRLADDVLPVVPDGESLVALPRFPQLKLPPEQHAGDLIPKRTPLAALYVLPAEHAGEEKIALQPLAPRQAALALVRHTVASRLFDNALLARHLAFCVDTAARTPVRRLIYPWRQEALPEVRDRIAADLEALSRG